MAGKNQWSLRWCKNGGLPDWFTGSRLLLQLWAAATIALFLLLSQPGQSLAANICAYKDGNDPIHPFFPIDAWIALQDGDQHWYAFRDEGDSTAISVRMSVLPSNGASFTILTSAQLSAWQRNEPVDAVGASAASAVLHDDQFWTGSFVQSGIYYVLVESRGRGLSNYMLSIQGSGVSFPLLSFAKPHPPIANKIEACPAASTSIPTPTLAPAPALAPASTESPSVEPTPAISTVVSSPDEPLPPIGRALPIQSGERHWYAFRDEGDDGTIAIRATANPAHCIAFALWTPEQLTLWQQDQEFRPVGQGTVNEQFNDDLFWTGSFVKSGTYYVVVDRDPVVEGACTYQLRVTGEDVSLVIAPRSQ